MASAQRATKLRHNLLARLARARMESTRIFDALKPQYLYERPIPERHRFIFYLGHLEAFDWNLFRGRLFDAVSPEPGLDSLFAFGIDPIGDGLPDDKPSDWPSPDKAFRYAQKLHGLVDEKLAVVCFSTDRIPGTDYSPAILL